MSTTLKKCNKHFLARLLIARNARSRILKENRLTSDFLEKPESFEAPVEKNVQK